MAWAPHQNALIHYVAQAEWWPDCHRVVLFGSVLVLQGRRGMSFCCQPRTRVPNQRIKCDPRCLKETVLSLLELLHTWDLVPELHLWRNIPKHHPRFWTPLNAGRPELTLPCFLPPVFAFLRKFVSPSWVIILRTRGFLSDSIASLQCQLRNNLWMCCWVCWLWEPRHWIKAAHPFFQKLS